MSIVALKPDALTWDQAQRLFLLRGRSQNLTTSTQKLYAVNLRMWLAWLAANGNPSPHETRSDTIRQFLQDKRDGGWMDSTVDCAYRIQRALWRFLEREGLLFDNPMKKVERPRRERRMIKAFTPEQVRLMLSAIDTKGPLGKRDYGICVLLADSGLRISEALSVRVSDVDFVQSIITVIGKGRKERLVPFGDTARRAILSWLKVRGDIPGVEALWCNRFGTPLKRRTLEDRIKDHGRKAGLTDVRCSAHTFRHFFALSYLRNGGDVLTLQRILGHSTLEMTRVYAQVADTDSIRQHRQYSPLDRMGALPGEQRSVKFA